METAPRDGRGILLLFSEGMANVQGRILGASGSREESFCRGGGVPVRLTVELVL